MGKPNAGSVENAVATDNSVSTMEEKAGQTSENAAEIKKETEENIDPGTAEEQVKKEEEKKAAGSG